MTPMLVVEARVGGDWREVGRLRPSDRPGSMSHTGPEGRKIYMFGCVGDHSYVRSSMIGIDGATRETREIVTAGFQEIAKLTSGSPEFECWLKTDQSPEPRRIRFRHEEGA